MSETKRKTPWDQALARRGLNQEKLAADAGVSKATVNRMVRGRGRPNTESVRKVAAVLTDGDTDAVWLLIGTGHFDYGDFPVESIVDELRLLTPIQRESLIALVRSMSDPKGKRSGDVANAAKKNAVDGVVEEHNAEEYDPDSDTPITRPTSEED